MQFGRVEHVWALSPTQETVGIEWEPLVALDLLGDSIRPYKDIQGGRGTHPLNLDGMKCQAS